MPSQSFYFLLSIALIAIASSAAFTAMPTTQARSAALFMAEEASEEVKAAPQVNGEQLELMLQEWDTPLVIDAYAQWCGPCLLMSPEFEAAAKELQGKVRLVKLDTDEEQDMANKLAINGLPTLLFLDKYSEGEEEEAKAVLKARIEGAIQKDQIMELCEHYFFDGPEPAILAGAPPPPQ